MKKEEKQQLKELLVKMATESEPVSDDEPQGRPAGFIPEICLKEFYKATRTPFIELVIYRGGENGWEYLYQDRNDEWWNGFCAFGGMVRPNHPTGPLEIAQKLLDREFKGMDIRVATLEIISFLNWPEHSWCNPFAVVCLIKVEGEIPEGDDRHWLSVHNLPERMIMNHDKYLEQCEYFLNHGGTLVFTAEEPDGIPRKDLLDSVLPCPPNLRLNS